jgi:hypothetical protein
MDERLPEAGSTETLRPRSVAVSGGGATVRYPTFTSPLMNGCTKQTNVYGLSDASANRNS